MAHVVCFWCETRIFPHVKNMAVKKTRDHLHSAVLRKQFQLEPPYEIRPSCYSCNNERGRISSFYEQVLRLKAGQSPEGLRLERMVRRFLQQVEIHRYREQVLRHLTGVCQGICLHEIDVVLNFLKEYVSSSRNIGTQTLKLSTYTKLVNFEGYTNAEHPLSPPVFLVPEASEKEVSDQGSRSWYFPAKAIQSETTDAPLGLFGLQYGT